MIYVINIDGSGRTPKPLTEGTSATWSPDGQKIAFLTGAYESDVSTVLNVINADGSGVRRLANTTETGPQFSPAWSPDGEKIAFFCPGGKGIDLCTINADGTGLTRVALKVAPEGSLETASWGSG